MSCTHCTAARQAAAQAVRQAVRGDVGGAIKSGREALEEFKAKLAARRGRQNR